MLFVPGFTMEDFYINAYGYDLRELDFAFKYTRNKSFDEKLFAQDPTANDHGLDRMLYYSHVMRFVTDSNVQLFLETYLSVCLQA